jgi:Thiol-disulfide isomerase and thioredoxins
MPRSLGLAVLVGAAVLIAVLYGKMGTNPNRPAPVLTPPPALALLKKTEPAKPVAVTRFAGPGGVMKSAADFKGKIVILNLWAPWCGPCVKELPALAALQKAVPAEKLVVVPVDSGRETLPEAQAFLVAHGAGNLQSYSDPNAQTLRALGGFGLPLTLLIGKDGKEIARAEGTPDWSNPEAIAYFKALAER